MSTWFEALLVKVCLDYQQWGKRQGENGQGSPTLDVLSLSYAMIEEAHAVMRIFGDTGRSHR